MQLPARVFFVEEQRLRQWWMVQVLVGSIAATAGFALWALYQQLILGEAVGNNPVSDGAFIALSLPLILLGLGLVWVLWAARMTVEVWDDGAYYRFFPFVSSFQRIPFDDVAGFETVTYNPLLEYGGWGVRWSIVNPGVAFSVSGNRGVRFTLKEWQTQAVGSPRGGRASLGSPSGNGRWPALTRYQMR